MFSLIGMFIATKFGVLSNFLMHQLAVCHIFSLLRKSSLVLPFCPF